MKLLHLAISSCLIPAAAQAEGEARLVRHIKESSGVVWDMPVASGQAALPQSSEIPDTARLQLWSLKNDAAVMLDGRVSGPFLPKASVRITTLDTDSPAPRTRVDQPFIVDVNVSGLLTEGDFPKESASVLLERRLMSENGITSEKPYRASIAANGATVLRFPASAITAMDPTQARGEEQFIIHALNTGDLPQSRIASAQVEVLPVASGEIRGIAQDSLHNRVAPKVQIALKDLYPKSQTHLLLYQGTQIHGNPSVTIHSILLDQKEPMTTVIRIPDFSAHMRTNGTYTLALVSETVYGRELLCDPVRFRIQRPPRPCELKATASR